MHLGFTSKNPYFKYGFYGVFMDFFYGFFTGFYGFLKTWFFGARPEYGFLRVAFTGFYG